MTDDGNQYNYTYYIYIYTRWKIEKIYDYLVYYIISYINISLVNKNNVGR